MHLFEQGADEALVFLHVNAQDPDGATTLLGRQSGTPWSDKPS